MKAFVICMAQRGDSIEAAQRCRVSAREEECDFEILPWDAVEAPDAPTAISKKLIKWTYPWQGEVNDFKTGLILSAYQTANKNARIGCFLSHYELWEYCVRSAEPILILEHDALFIRKLDPKPLLDSRYGIIGINDPRGATRRSNVFHQQVQNMQEDIGPVPMIDDPRVPQGLAGNSAYLIKPEAASKVIAKVKEIGAWPNDALMCYQNFNYNLLGVTKQYYTRVQGTRSTTTLEMPFS